MHSKGSLWEVALCVVLLGAWMMSPGQAEARGRGARKPKGEVIQPAESGRRVALIIGNGRYQEGPLRNPPADAALLSETLQKLGFEVRMEQNLTRRDMLQVIDEFGEKLKARDIEVGLFFYAGHGVQVKGKNYLIPVDAEMSSENQVEYDAVDVGRVLSRMEEARLPLNLVVLDACRNNPFERSWRSGTAGLAMTQAPGGTLVAYATNPGNVAQDGNGRNSPYSAALARYLSQPGLEIGDVMREVGREVRAQTGESQQPWIAGSVVHRWYPSGPCAEGQKYDFAKGACVASVTCPENTILEGGKCVAQATCPPNTVWDGKQCMARVACPPGSTWDGQRCIASVSCPEGTLRHGDRCVAVVECPSGQHFESGRCVGVVTAQQSPIAPTASAQDKSAPAPQEQDADPDQEAVASIANPPSSGGPASNDVPPTSDRKPARQDENGVSGQEALGWFLTILPGAGGLIVGGVSSYQISQSNVEAERLSQASDVDSESLYKTLSVLRNSEITQWVGYGVGIVGLATGIYLIVTDSGSDTKIESQALRLSPWMGKDSGVFLEGVW